FNMSAVPEGLEQGVGKAEEEHAVHRLLAQIMVNPEDRLFVESLEEHYVKRARRSKVAPERFFDDDARVAGATGPGQLLDDGCEGGGRDGQIMGRPLGRSELSSERLKCRRVVVV